MEQYAILTHARNRHHRVVDSMRSMGVEESSLQERLTWLDTIMYLLRFQLAVWIMTSRLLTPTIQVIALLGEHAPVALLTERIRVRGFSRAALAPLARAIKGRCAMLVFPAIAILTVHLELQPVRQLLSALLVILELDLLGRKH